MTSPAVIQNVVSTTVLVNRIAVQAEVDRVVNASVSEDVVHGVVSEDVVHATVVGQQGPQGIQGPPGGSQIVLDEPPTGTINGSNATFTTAFQFVPGQVAVKVNGLTQRLVTDFQTSGTNTIIFAESPHVGDSISVDYERTS